MKRQKNTRQGKNEFERLKVCSYHIFKQSDLKAKLRVTTLQEHRKKTIASVLMVIATVFEAMGCYFHFCPCQEARTSLTHDEIKRGTKTREMDELRKDYNREKG